MNAFTDDAGFGIPTLEIDADIEGKQKERLAAFRQRRDQAATDRALAEVRRAAKADENVMPALIDAARHNATVGETVNALADVLGRYEGTVR